MKKVKKIIGIVLFTLIILVTAAYFIIKSTIPDFDVTDVNLKNIDDGLYIGEYSAGPVKAVVKVQVQDNCIADIIIEEHDNGFGKPAEKITEKIISMQSLNVDAISGATLSSNVIRKAIEEALNK